MGSRIRESRKLGEQKYPRGVSKHCAIGYIESVFSSLL